LPGMAHVLVMCVHGTPGPTLQIASRDFAEHGPDHRRVTFTSHQIGVS
jgi:hypothetical protein